MTILMEMRILENRIKDLEKASKSELIWKKVEDELPEMTNKYLVRRKVQDTPTPAVYNTQARIWLIQIHGHYWQILGVYDWTEMPRRKKQHG